MSIRTQHFRTQILESEPVNTALLLTVLGRALSEDDITSWDLRVFDLQKPSRAIIKILNQSPAGVVFDSIQDGFGAIPGGYNFLHTVAEGLFPEGSHRGGAVYRFEYKIRTTDTLASTKMALIDVQIVNALSS